MRLIGGYGDFAPLLAQGRAHQAYHCVPSWHFLYLWRYRFFLYGALILPVLHFSARSTSAQFIPARSPCEMYPEQFRGSFIILLWDVIMLHVNTYIRRSSTTTNLLAFFLIIGLSYQFVVYASLGCPSPSLSIVLLFSWPASSLGILNTLSASLLSVHVLLCWMYLPMYKGRGTSKPSDSSFLLFFYASRFSILHRFPPTRLGHADHLIHPKGM